MTVALKINTLDECPICLEEMDQSEDTQKLKCDHLFHEACIGKWLNTAPTCPLCRIVATDLTPMPRPPEMTLDEILAVTDYHPHNHAMAINDLLNRIRILSERHIQMSVILGASLNEGLPE